MYLKYSLVSSNIIALFMGILHVKANICMHLYSKTIYPSVAYRCVVVWNAILKNKINPDASVLVFAKSLKALTWSETFVIIWKKKKKKKKIAYILERKLTLQLIILFHPLIQMHVVLVITEWGVLYWLPGAVVLCSLWVGSLQFIWGSGTRRFHHS